MRALRVDDQQNLCWSEVPDPKAKPGQVVIEIHAAGVNRADLLQRVGRYASPPDWPDWMGLEVAGVIVGARPESRWKRGDKVCALLGGGGYAERVAVPEELVLPLPLGLSMAEGAALPEVFATAYLNLVIEAGIQADDTVLIHAGASGLGIAAIQLAKLFGARVVTTVGSEKKAEVARRLGADVVVLRHTDDLEKVLDANPVSIALDCVGGEALGRHLGKMAPGGRWILVATLGGVETTIPLRMVLTRGLRLIGSTLRSRTNAVKARILQELERVLWPRLSDGSVRPVIHAILPVMEAEAAHAILERNENIGKVILRVRDESEPASRLS